MKIAIDARMIQPGSMHGIARYVFQLICCIKKEPNKDHIYYILVNKKSPLLAMEWPDYIKCMIIKSSWISFREQIEIPQVLRAIKADLFHSPSFVAPLFCPCEMIMTIHDLNHLVLSQYYTTFHQLYYKVFVKRCINRSKFVLTVSNFSKTEIVKNLQLDPNKVFVTYNGVDEHYQPVKNETYVEYIRELYELPAKFIFCLSNNKPHKNVHQLVRAFCYSRIDIPLVLASPVNRKLIQLAESFGKKHLLYFSKFIQETHLPTVYSMTDLFVYPSTYEGFGLPPLEALACGTPVVVAQSSSLPEVVGDNAIFADPFDYVDIARALEEGIGNEVLRTKNRKNGLAHVQKFRWEIMAKQTIDLYDQCTTKKSVAKKGHTV